LRHAVSYDCAEGRSLPEVGPRAYNCSAKADSVPDGIYNGEILTKDTMQQIVLKQPLAGLEEIATYHVQALPLDTLLAIGNRYLRFEFPPERDYELCLRLIQKGLIQPKLSKYQLSLLPMITIETLAKWVFSISLGVSYNAPVTGEDVCLTAICAIEDWLQHDSAALVSEDLAQLEAHPLGSMHADYFRLSPDWQKLSRFLEGQGYIPIISGIDGLDSYFLYWFCRKTSVILPWAKLLGKLTKSTGTQYPFLSRLKHIREAVKKNTPNFPKTPAACVGHVAEIISWVRGFSVYSKQCRVVRPVNVLVLLEGATETLLIPAIARAMGYNLYEDGIDVLGVGGKNQMLETYVYYAERLKGPICVVMDKDAEDLVPDLNYYRRPNDKVFILEQGEFEDLYDNGWVVHTIQAHYQPTQPITEKHWAHLDSGSRVKVLQDLWHELGLGEFDKVTFAEHLAETLTNEKLLSEAMKNLVGDILTVAEKAGEEHAVLQ
jgi:hypothetical protein